VYERIRHGQPGSDVLGIGAGHVRGPGSFVGLGLRRRRRGSGLFLRFLRFLIGCWAAVVGGGVDHVTVVIGEAVVVQGVAVRGRFRDPDPVHRCCVFLDLRALVHVAWCGG